MDEDTLETNVAAPKSMTVDGNTASQHPIADQIDFLDRKAANDAASSAKRGVVFQRMKPPGTT